ncbi:MAG: cell division protein FtsZ [Anaerovibrio sp.]|uniref:cell division protein FtsZ n=1 Tax=Anaerovibrio sp. TaxID=1872532 RepID=UPI0025DBADAA|nr:cell division protein FtsZ [Anaerovibrio sp.]MCR5177144.1 cell division protein FtsZ [Anaerovibrio sp.]
MLTEFDDFADKTVIKIVGVGGGGSNAINCMVNAGLKGVEFITIDTDKKALSQSLADVRIPLINMLGGGLGNSLPPNADSKIGDQTAKAYSEEIRDALKGADMVFIVAGMGGTTGTSATPVVAECAKEVGALTIGVVTRPFTYEGSVRSKRATVGMDNLRQYADTTIVISDDRVLNTIDKSTSFRDAFKDIDDIIRQGVQSICELVIDCGYINLDFEDVKTVLGNAGQAFMCIGEASGDNAPMVAIRNAVNSTLMEEPASGARSIIINFIGEPSHINMMTLNEAAQCIVEQAHPDANILWGISVDDTLGDTIRAVIVAAIFNSEESKIAFLKKRAEAEHIEISNEALACIANRVGNSPRELEGALNRVVAYSELAGENITSDLVANALKDVYPES